MIGSQQPAARSSHLQSVRYPARHEFGLSEDEFGGGFLEVGRVAVFDEEASGGAAHVGSDCVALGPVEGGLAILAHGGDLLEELFREDAHVRVGQPGPFIWWSVAAVSLPRSGYRP